MDAEFYNKLSIPYQTISDSFTTFLKTYHNNYAIYDKKIFTVRESQFEFLKQFKEIPFKTFFTDNYLKEHDLGGTYYNSETVVETEKTLSIHTEFSMILFYYLINELKDDIIKFMDLLGSKAFEAKFSGFYEIKKYKLKYNLLQHELFFKFMSANIPNFGFIYHLFHRTNSGYMYVNEDRMVIRVQGIKDLLKANDEIYDFQKYRII